MYNLDFSVMNPVSLKEDSVKLNWSSFFDSLPKDLSARVKKREAVCSVRILTNEETGGPIAVKVFSTNGKEEAHIHYNTKQIFVIISGQLSVWKTREIEGKIERIERNLRAGEWLCINPGEWHGFSGTALVGGVDIGEGTALDTHEVVQASKLPKLNLKAMRAIDQGVVTIQTFHLEQSELLSNQNENIEIIAETITATNRAITQSNRLVVIASGIARVTSQNVKQQEYRPGDAFFVSANEDYLLSPSSNEPVITLHFNLFKNF